MKNTLYRVLFNLLFWTSAFTLVFAIRYASGEEFGIHQLVNPIAPVRVFGNGLIMGLTVGIAYSAMESYLKYYRNVFSRSLTQIIFQRGIRQFFIASTVITIVAWLNYRQDIQEGFIDAAAVTFGDYLTSATVIFLFVTALAGNTILSIFRTLQMKIGETIFLDLLKGKYMEPVEEDRAFLFMDLTSSTTIAEQMGHRKYSEFIQDCFKDLDSVLGSNAAVVYQYVGDEVVLTWKSPDALKNTNALNAFFQFEDKLKCRADYYTTTYEIQPVFKAGLHMGRVMTAEVGVIKRDIAYHSDVLNTAARIMSKCNELGASLLTTRDVTDGMPYTNEYEFIPKGAIPLRGKRSNTDLFEVRRKK